MNPLSLAIVHSRLSTFKATTTCPCTLWVRLSRVFTSSKCACTGGPRIGFPLKNKDPCLPHQGQYLPTIVGLLLGISRDPNHGVSLLLLGLVRRWLGHIACGPEDISLDRRVASHRLIKVYPIVQHVTDICVAVQRAPLHGRMFSPLTRSRFAPLGSSLLVEQTICVPLDLVVIVGSHIRAVLQAEVLLKPKLRCPRPQSTVLIDSLSKEIVTLFMLTCSS